MCTVNDAGDIEDLSSSVKILNLKVKVLPEKCNKCKEQKPNIILRSKDAYCKECFLASTVHKFKALLGRHRLLKENDRVLVYYKGGHPGTALLNFLRTGLDLHTPKRLRFVPICLFIEEQSFPPQTRRLENLRRVENELKIFNIPIFFTSFWKYHKNGSSESIFLTENIEELILEEGATKNGTILSESLSNDLKKIYERRLLIDAAKKLNCKFIFTPELSTDIASQILANVALGRGSHIPLDTGFCDTRDKQVTILRPLRVFDIKELALYNYFSNLDPVVIPEQHKNTYSSVQNLIEKFVNDLQSNYPATVTTVLKTGDKLSMQNSKTEDVRICYICHGPIESSNHHLTSQEAIQFSHEISTGLKEFQTPSVVGNTDQDSNKKTCFSCSKIEDYLIF